MATGACAFSLDSGQGSGLLWRSRALRANGHANKNHSMHFIIQYLGSRTSIQQDR